MATRPADADTPILPREQWSTRLGFLLATLGAAIGLGNIWRFAYVAGDNGGGAFLVVYLLAVALVGIPLFLAELAIGRHGRGDVVQAFERIAPRHPLRFIGHVTLLAAALILSYYSVIAGWTLRYMAEYVVGLAVGLPGGEPGLRFRQFIEDPLQPVIWHLAFMALTLLVVLGGVKRGIEATNRVLMPLLAVIVVGLAIYALTLPGAMAGVRFLLAPDWSALTNPRVYLAALGQAFFSLGLAMGVLATYGSYMSRAQNLPPATVTIAAGDTLFAVVAGLAIFPAVFAFGLAPAQGPVLAFVVLPEVFAGMTGGTVVGAAFFVLLSGAALTSAVSLLEVPVAYVERRCGVTRRRAAVIVAAGIFVLGIPSALGFGPWSGVSLFGRGILDMVDAAVSNFVLPLVGLATAVLAGWVWDRRSALEEADLRPDRAWARLWLVALRYGVPLVIVLILLGLIGAL